MNPASLVSWELQYTMTMAKLIWKEGPRYNPEDYVFFDYDGAEPTHHRIHWRAQGKADGERVEAAGRLRPIRTELLPI